MESVWVLAMVLKIGAHEIILRPYERWPDFYSCTAWKDYAARELQTPMTCYEDRDTAI